MIHNIDPQLTQWDVGRSVTVSDTKATHIHFANQGDSKAVIIEIENGSAKIPDYLLQTGKSIIAYAVLDGVTLESKSFPVRKRERPENYVYEDDQRNYIYELIASAEDAVANANQATASANTAAGSANLASTRANEAATSANIATQNANEATEKANEATTKAVNAVKNMMVVGEAQGESIAIDNAIDQTLVGLRVFGKTTQNGTPTPDAPVELVSVGDSGNITVNVTGSNDSQSLTLMTPNGLPGIPVASGGNYTDANGQQWICDEIDFARGVYVKRISKYTFTGNEISSIYGSVNANGYGRMQTLCEGSPSAFKDIAVGVPSLCAKYISDSAINIGSLINGGGTAYKFGYLNDRQMVFSTQCNTVESFKAEISGTTILYQLATTTETPLSEEELAAYASLHTYKDNTTVSNDAGAYMELEYVMDAKKYINSLVTGGIAPATIE